MFLNTDNLEFADISAASGVDFPDDGRGAGTVDWDLDGDLDLWITNRTAPRVRFLRNNTSANNSTLSVHLEAVIGNRDAIGARLELYVPDRARPLLRTIRGGEGYLSQSSKWVHFGLGSTDQIDRLVVRWPGGEAEEFTELEVDHWYEIVQFEAAQEWKYPRTRSVELDNSPVKLPEPKPSSSRLLITRRSLAPNFMFVDKSGTQRQLTEFSGHPILISLWAPWCTPCLKELASLEKEYAALHDKGLVVLALNVDGLDGTRAPDRAGATRFLNEHASHLIAGNATRPIIADLELALSHHFSSRFDLPLPSSMLLDSNRQFAAMYAGPVSPEQLVEDVELVQSRPEEIASLALPFEGIWIEPQDAPPSVAIVTPWPQDAGSPQVPNGLWGFVLSGAVLLALVVAVAAWVTKSRADTRS